MDQNEYKNIIATVKKDLKKINSEDLQEGYEYHGPDIHYFDLTKVNAAMATAMEYEDLYQFDCWQANKKLISN